MPRQLVRLSEVRTPQLTGDNYTSAQIQGAEAASRTTEDYLQYVLSQIRLIQGTESWKQPPAANLTSVAATMEQVQADMAQVAQLSAQVAALTQRLEADEQGGATQAQILSLKQQITALTNQLTYQSQTAASQIASLGQAVSALQATVAQQATVISGFVTQTGLSNALGSFQVFDQLLAGVRNKSNRVFLTPGKFILGTLRVSLNGQRLYPGSANDYVAQESSLGLGYNQIRLTAYQAAPSMQDLLTADYVRA